MPYITQERRWFYKNVGSDMYPVDEKAGDLNYQITRIVDLYLQHHGKSYQTINDIVGALEGAKLEFYRRVAVGYEEQKRHDNGDVYHD